MNILSTQNDNMIDRYVPHDRQEIRREIIDFVKLIVWFLILILGLRTYVIEGYEVQGESMEPYIETRERILVLKLPHVLSQFSLFRGIDAIKPGDVVVFDSPGDPDKRYVKRVIAIGPKRDNSRTVGAADRDGQSSPDEAVLVRFDRGAVYVNNHIIEEDYLEADARVSKETQSLTLGPGEYYVLGDNRKSSKDSRSFDAIKDDMIIGKVVLRFWPPRRAGLLK